ncbi:MAG TPA: GNAT family N-acetyltransferase [Thermoleophilia bacterium]|nr:GNAT family N-acetyltransferase [Thermoleophilia bacterium]
MTIPDGYILRHPTTDEAPAVQAVLDAAESADTGEARHHEDDVATDWSIRRCVISENWWVAVAGDGSIVGVAFVWPETAGEVTADHYVHPDHRGRGLGEALLDTIEARLTELPALSPEGDVRQVLMWCEDSDAERRASLERRGFSAGRQYFEMARDLTGEFGVPVWPSGIVARGFRPGLDDRTVYEADVEAFSEHHLYEARAYDEWRTFHVEAKDGDVTLWWLAWEGDQLAGYVIPFAQERGAAIGDLAVRKPWRGRGIGHALLLAAFGTLHDRGQTVVRLYVDAQNVTNAVAVYEAAGMHVARRFDVMSRTVAREAGAAP